MAAALAVSARVSAFKDAPSAKALAAAAGTYVAAYERSLQYVVADEIAVQHVRSAIGLQLQTRTTRAEFFLTYLDVQKHWMAVRDVTAVDGQPVTDTPPIRTLLAMPTTVELARLIAERNSRYNIGGISRTFNEPTLALLVLDDAQRERFRFDRPKPHNDDAPDAPVVVSFRERDEPTLIRSNRNDAVYTKGTLRIRPSTGAVDQTHIEMSIDGIEASIDTVYAMNDTLQMLVPSEMYERYDVAGSRSITTGSRQIITADSTYRNYRRFDTAVIIK